MAPIEKFEDLEVWQRAREICKYMEQLFQTTPISKNFKLRDQMEGSSASELKSQAYRALDKSYISIEQFNQLSELCETEKNKIGAFM